MHTYAFNPFRTTIKDIQAEDLAILKDVNEGWYIDYKREGIKPVDLAKHLSAFSNQYGGFLIIGVTEKDRKANIFNGIARETIEQISLQIREAATAHVNPPILYEEHVLLGPCETIGLAEGKAIFILGIPRGTNPPYIHSSGRIYRRLADQSKPKEETDRYILDDLWKRGRQERDNISKFLKNTPELPKPQEHSTWAFVYLSSDLQLPNPEVELSFNKFQNYTIGGDETVGTPFMPMQSAYSSPGGYIARQVENNNPGLSCVALRWWHGGVARLEIPINTFSKGEFIKRLEKYKYAQRFCQEFDRQGFEDNAICDFSVLLGCLAALSNIYHHLLNETGDSRPIHASYELYNVFYKMPFIDSEKYLHRCFSTGIPVIQDRTIRYPRNPYFDNMPKLFDPKATTHTSNNRENNLFPYSFMAPIAYHILNSTGVISDISDIHDEEVWTSYQLENFK
jgi:hypothetical protein